MADESQAIRTIDWRELFPFTHIFRAFRIAIHPSKLVLGLLLILSLYVGGRVLDAVWPSASLPNTFDIQQYEELRWLHASRNDLSNVPLPEQAMYAELKRALEAAQTDAMANAQSAPDSPKIGISVLFFAYEVQQASAVIKASYSNWGGVIHGLTNFLVIGPTWLVRTHLVYCVFFFAIFLVVWAIFGGAISRIAAVHVARDEKISVRQAVSFSTSKILSFIFAPLIPLIIILIGGIVVAIGALIFYVPYVGPLVAACFFFLALVAGFIMTLVATGMISGLNLMYPTIAIEGSDSFDAISRSFSYVFARPWRMIFYNVVALVYGALCYAFVHWFVFVMLKLTHLFAAWWLRGQTRFNFAAIWPSPDIQSLAYPPAYAALKGSDPLSAGIIAFWIYLVIAMLAAFVISFYFSASTIIYGLMRAEVDATELEDVYVEETDEDFGDLATPNRPSDVAAVVPISETTPPATEPAPESPPAQAPPP